MDEPPWHQVNIAYPGESREQGEAHAIDHLSKVMPAAEEAGLITSWWFMRKGPWRVRYAVGQPSNGTNPIHQLLTESVVGTRDIYEPEIYAFGGLKAMQTAHTLFHADSRHLLAYLHGNRASRRETSLLLTTTLMRAAGLDLEEQGDVWARVAEQRAEFLHHTPLPDVATWTTFVGHTRTLLIGSPRAGGSNIQWHNAFTTAGRSLQQLRVGGILTRGLRAVITKHVIFHWNRIGIPGTAQACLAQAAKEALLGAPQD